MACVVSGPLVCLNRLSSRIALIVTGVPAATEALEVVTLTVFGPDG